ncbi:hypothetical protein IU500_24735 [Nocardia terpenica]|uniref:hypothetical protein n=1 Tax=Nocardia terpenica TaxID=455432 RepID=UPI001896194C|nr:hypothetical protein [Nocardia terpenica]MBF6064709.1 hypothetical protein [Nocardia terpenica]MBF6107224.1 hypothetical protein [Nocardia terpenica]MBF6114981.1 hypothetical protein [Nocardia terpenica]MBF6122087.1 hypothetical protein [Nocardia terpenica]MBF6154470.1 hypothetical protein [Nocardia terpenica]
MTGEPDLERLCADYNRRWNLGAFACGGVIVFYTGRIQILSVPRELVEPLQRELTDRGVFAPCFDHVATGIRSYPVTSTLTDDGAHRLRMELLDRPHPRPRITVSRNLVGLPSGSESKHWIVEPTGADSYPKLLTVLEIADRVRTTIPGTGGSDG